MLRLKLLGGPVLEGDEGALTGPAAHRHSLALLALLACAPDRTLTRGKLIGFLWPEVSETKARSRLSTCVHRLRAAAGSDVLVSVGGDVRMNEELVSCDLRQFRQALERGDPAGAVALYRGPFLDGFWLRDSPEFERWTEIERDRLSRAYREALEELAAETEASGDFLGAGDWWRERAREDPFDSRVAVRLMETLAAAGNRAEALRTAAAHVRLLEEELGAGSGAEVRALAEALQREPAGTEGRSSAGGSPSTDEGGVRPASDADAGAAQPQIVIAVLPFEELGKGDAAAAFADGLHTDLVTRLSGVRALTVISRTSVLRYRNTTLSIPRIARTLGAGTIVEGGVQYVGGRVRLNVQLIDARRDVHRWAETYDRELTAGNLFEIQSELAERITRSLRAELTTEEKERVMEWTPTESLEAYRLHAEGRVRLDKRTEGGMRRAVERFRRAISEDEAYAPAWVGLADALTLLHEYGYEEAGDTLPEAEEAAARALAVDERLAAAHASRGLIHEARHQGPQAIRALRRAVELQPSYAEAHNWLSWTWQLLGHADEALASARRAVELNPLSPEAVSNLSVSLASNGRSEEAAREAQRAHDLQPTWNTPPFYRAIALLDLGRFDEAESLLRDLAVPWAGSGPLITRALVCAATGRREEAEEFLRGFEAEGDDFGAAMVHLALGGAERAFDALERIERWEYWPTLAMHHHYRELLGPTRERPRFRELLERVNRHWGLEPDGSLPD